jgi:hypothetical protein
MDAYHIPAWPSLADLGGTATDDTIEAVKPGRPVYSDPPRASDEEDDDFDDEDEDDDDDDDFDDLDDQSDLEDDEDDDDDDDGA